jgi:hypothetical protein
VNPEYKASRLLSKCFEKKAEIVAASGKEISSALSFMVIEGRPFGLVKVLLETGQ